MLTDPDVELPLSPEELAIWKEVLAQRPRFEADHDYPIARGASGAALDHA